MPRFRATSLLTASPTLWVAGLLLFLSGCSFSGNLRETERPADPAETETAVVRPVLRAAPDAPIVTFEPRFLTYKPPDYPRLAQQAGLEGEVTLQVRIDAKGSPDVVEVIESSGTGSFDDAAVAAAYQCQYIPARQETRAVPFVVRYTVPFRLPR